MWDPRVVITSVLRGTLFNKMHLGHLGIVKMKKVAQSYAWWPGIDRDIEILVKSCDDCLQTSNKPSPVSLHPWRIGERPLQRIRIELCGTFLQQMFLIMIDIKSTTATKSIDEFRCLFSRWEISEQIVRDDETQFKSDEFKQFLSENGIIHT